MVAISLYRGNLHRIPPDVGRRWLMPTPCISLKDFRSLLFRRSKALSLLPSSSSSIVSNPDLSIKSSSPKPDDDVDDKTVSDKEKENDEEDRKKEAEDNDKVEKRKREVEEKLHILNEKKHNLVQALKQILNAEEELKRRNSVQASRPPLPLQVDASNDSGSGSGSMTRHATPTTGSEAILTVDMEGAEGDDAINNNPQCTTLLRMSSTSPSAESALRRQPYFHHNVASHPSRTLVVAGSPSRFAPSGNQCHLSNLPSVSVSGTNYFASSPSPAASGGTSVFKDARHPSPWN